MQSEAAAAPPLPGLNEGTILTRYGQHIAHEIWIHPNPDESVPRQLKAQTRQKCFELWFPRIPTDPEPESWFALAQESGLLHILKGQFWNVDHNLLSAFVERRQPETNTFHLNFGELGIGLHDVLEILELPIDGGAVTTPWTHLGLDADSAQCAQLFSYLFGVDLDNPFDVEEQAMVKFIGRGKVGEREFFCHVVSMINSRRRSDPGSIATGFLWHLIQQSLFVNKTSNLLDTCFLPLLEDPSRIHEYAWGTGCLALLYRQLGIASRARCVQFSGCVRLLEIWIWLHFPYFPGNPNLDVNSQEATARVSRYSTGRAPLRQKRTLQQYRRILDEYAPEDVSDSSKCHSNFFVFNIVINCYKLIL